jgi:hypothetical protein
VRTHRESRERARSQRQRGTRDELICHVGVCRFEV